MIELPVECYLRNLASLAASVRLETKIIEVYSTRLIIEHSNKEIHISPFWILICKFTNHSMIDEELDTFSFGTYRNRISPI